MKETLKMPLMKTLFATWLVSAFFLLGREQGLSQTQPGEGLKAGILSAGIPNHRKPVVTFKISDGQGHPLDPSDLGEVRFTVAALRTDKQGREVYYNYVLSKETGKEYKFQGQTRKPVLAETLQPDYDHGGSFTRIRKGVFTYTFKTTLPRDFDRKATHVIGGEITRDHRRHVVNPLYHFVPAGGKPRQSHLSLQTAACNQCHDPLSAHGGLRRDVGYCALCHTSQLVDPETGQDLDLKVLVHKIHRGKNLPSVEKGAPFFAVGFRQRVFDFSGVGYPQDPRNCTGCHGSPKEGAWMQAPATAPCTSCHDDVNLKTGENHPGGPQADLTCALCHQPKGDEFGPSVTGAHTLPRKSAQLPGVVLDILRVGETRPGQNPVVTFSVKDKKGNPLDASAMTDLQLTLAWPTVDYHTSMIEDARKATPSGNGVYTYRFKHTLPAEANGSGAVGIQGNRRVDLKKPDGSLIKGVRDTGFNVVKYFSITDRQPVKRRTVITLERCNACHESLAVHGESRTATEYCVLCHNVSKTDAAKRKVAKGPMPPKNITFNYLIHSLHTGEELGEPFVIYGGPPFRPGAIDFSEIRYPGDRRNCQKCHEKGTNEIPLPPGLLAMAVPQSDGSLKHVPPVTTACIACHTKESARAHAETQTASGGRESCVVCHAAGRDFDVAKVHQR